LRDIDQQTDIDNVLALVQRFARRFLPYDAEELAQVVMIKAWRAYRAHPSISEWNDAQIAGWLKKITRNTAIDMLRAARLREPFSHEITDVVRETCMASSGAESGIEAREHINAALSHLPERQRTLLILTAQGYTYKEMADQEQSTRGSVASALSRAKDAFKREWEAAA
jgi:RNA polymerase sigma-70 factor (ECF subfamily)